MSGNNNDDDDDDKSDSSGNSVGLSVLKKRERKKTSLLSLSLIDINTYTVPVAG